VNPDASRQLANHAAYLLASAYPPGSTELNVSTGTPFGAALDTSLRQRGFILSPTGKTVAYGINFIDPSTCYIQLILPDGRISQSYSLKNNIVSPLGYVTKSGIPDLIHPISPPVSKEPLESPPVIRVEKLSAATIDAQEKENSAKNRTEEVSKALAETAQATEAAEKTPVLSANVAQIAKVVEKAPVPVADAYALAQGDVISPSDAEAEQVKILAAKITEHSSTSPEQISPVEEWRIIPGMLSPQLRVWAGKAGYTLVWQAPHDFILVSDVVFNGTFQDAVSRLFSAMHQNGTLLRVTIYQHNHVVEVLEE
jgi:hypothetical protein